MCDTIKQKHSTECGIACLAFIADYYGLQIPIAHIRQIAAAERNSNDFSGIISTAKQLNFDIKGVKGDINALPKISLPAIAHIVVDSHTRCYVVIKRLEKESIVYMDPIDGSSHRLSLNDFNKLWTGFLILLIPSKSPRKELLGFKFMNTLIFG